MRKATSVVPDMRLSRVLEGRNLLSNYIEPMEDGIPVESE
jgi:hypothetical protein